MNDRNDPLVQRAAALPESIEPGRDLWPGIAERLTPVTRIEPVSRRSVWPVALAASLTLAAVSSAITWWFVARPDLNSARIVGLMTEPAQPYFEDVELLTVRASLTDSLDQSLMRLSPGTRRQVSMNLLNIHQSLAEIRVALEQDPNNTFLHQLLYSTYLQEIGLLTNINRVAMTLPGEIET